MVRIAKQLWTAVFVVFMFCVGILVADKRMLCDNVILLDIKLDSSSGQDALANQYFEEVAIGTLEWFLLQKEDRTMRSFITSNLAQIDEALRQNAADCFGFDGIRLTYDSGWYEAVEAYNLPPGRYSTLQVWIGNGQGVNSIWAALPGNVSAVGMFSDTICEVESPKGKLQLFLLSCIGYLEKLWMVE